MADPEMDRVYDTFQRPKVTAEQDRVEALVDERYRRIVQRHFRWHVSKSERGDWYREVAIELQRELLKERA